MSKQAFEKKLAGIETIRSLPDEGAILLLRKSLRHRNNYVVGKAARMAGERQLQALRPDLLEAFDRFLLDGAKTDPQCWAKNDIAKALKDLDHSDAEVFTRGIRHVQMEPVWGAQQDTASTLRGICALALTGCGIPDHEALLYLVDLLADPESPARRDAITAIGQLGTTEGTLLLRLKARIGDPDPAVTGQCFATLIDMLPREYLPIVGKFLGCQNRDVTLEAAGALAASREPAALPMIEAFWNRLHDPEMQRDLLILIAGSPNPASLDLLLSIATSAPEKLAAQARDLAGGSRFRERAVD